MKKYLIILLILLWTPAYATDYYGGAAGKNINADDLWYTAVTGSCAGDGSPVASATVLQAGNTLYANGCDITVNVSYTATKTSTALGGAANAVSGGSFNVATSTSPLTITSAIEGGATTSKPGLTITGNANANPALTIVGTGTGGSAASASGIYSTHTVGTVVMTGSGCTGGSNATAHGCNFSGTGGLIMAGDSLGVTGTGLKIAAFVSSSTTGNCTGSSTAAAAPGCDATSVPGSTTFKIIGNIINGYHDDGVASEGARGNYAWDPGSLGDNRYIQVNGDGTPATVYATVPPNEEDVESGLDYGWDGAPMSGTLSSGGGGAWAF
jgi:hypothetical protein